MMLFQPAEQPSVSALTWSQQLRFELSCVDWLELARIVRRPPSELSQPGSVSYLAVLLPVEFRHVCRPSESP
jgi:hypothetical protein